MLAVEGLGGVDGHISVDLVVEKRMLDSCKGERRRATAETVITRTISQLA